MQMTFQTFCNSIFSVQKQERLQPKLRTHLLNLVLAHWKFSGSPITARCVQDVYGKKFTGAMSEFVSGVIATIQNVLDADPSFLKDVWNYSEIAHSIESQRHEEAVRNRRIYRIVDGPRELPQLAGYSQADD